MTGDRARSLHALSERDQAGAALLQRGLVAPLRLVAEPLGLVRQPRRPQQRARLVGLRQALRLLHPLRQVLERTRGAVLRILDRAAREVRQPDDRRASVSVQSRHGLGEGLGLREPPEPVARVHEGESQVAQTLEPEPALDRLPHRLGPVRLRERLGKPRLPRPIQEEARGERVGRR